MRAPSHSTSTLCQLLTMARTGRHCNSTREGIATQEFTNDNLTAAQSRRRAASLLKMSKRKELLRNIQGLGPEDQRKFVDKVDRVRRDCLLFRDIFSIVSAKAYPTANPQDAKFISALGNVCSAIGRLPTSAVLSAGLEKHGDMALASGGLTDVWRGKLWDAEAAIKALRIYPAKDLKEAKEVRAIQSAHEVFSRTRFTDPVGAGAHVEEAASR